MRAASKSVCDGMTGAVKVDKVVIGTSPFSVLAAIRLKRFSSGTVCIIASDTRIGGVWRNSVINGSAYEAFPHAVEFEQNSDLALLSNCLGIPFESEAKGDVLFWVSGKAYKAMSRLDSFFFAAQSFRIKRSFKRLFRQLRFAIRPRRYCIPVGGFKAIEPALRSLIKRSEIDIINDFITDINAASEDEVTLSGLSAQYTCSSVCLPRGATGFSVTSKGLEFKSSKQRNILILFIGARSEKLARYNKFHHYGFVDRISKVDNDRWVVQFNLPAKSQDDSIESMVACAIEKITSLELFEGAISVLSCELISAASFNWTDIEFSRMQQAAPKSVELLDSKALSYILMSDQPFNRVY